MSKSRKVALLYGGESTEREVSRQSARAVAGVMEELNCDYDMFDVYPQLLEMITEYEPDLAFNLAHGGLGEDGRLSATLDKLGIPYVGSDCAASSLAMDKYLSKRIWRLQNLPVFTGMLLPNLEEAIDLAKKEDTLPWVLKPRTGGSSFGISKVETVEQVEAAYLKARNYGEVMLEPFLSGPEFTVGIIGDEALPPIRIEVPGSGFYDYEAKYVRRDTKYRIPACMSRKQEQELQDLALQASQALGCRDWARVDFIQSPRGTFYLLEINTVPGMTTTSLIPKAAQARGWSLAEVCERIMSQAELRYNRASTG